VIDRVIEWLVPPSTRPADDDLRRARVLATVSCLVIIGGTIRAASLFAWGQFGGVFVMSAVFVSACVLLWVHRGRSVVVAANLQLTALLLAATLVIIFQGSVASPMLRGLAVVPMLAVYLVGYRAGIAWLLVIWGCALGVVPFAQELARQQGMTSAQPGRGDQISVILIPLVLVGIATIYEWSRRAAVQALVASEQDRKKQADNIRLLRTDRLATVGLLAAGVGHEINNPLTYVMGNIELVLRRSDNLNEKQRGELTKAYAGAERIARITKQLQTFSKGDEQAVRRQVSIDDAGTAALALVRKEVTHRATLQVELTDSPRVWADEPQLVQVFVNLLLNAAHAVEEAGGGSVWVRSGRNEEHGWLEVADDGAGIGDELMPRVCDPFVTTKSPNRGTGLGLSICKNIVDDHDGILTITSKPNDGTRARVQIPLAGERSTPVAIERHEAHPAASYRIVVIDDEPQIGRVMKRMLAPHDVVVCHSGQQALDLLAKDAAVDVILCDVMMDGMDGPQVLRAVQRDHPALATQFAFITGGAFTDSAKHFLQDAAVPCLTKPVNHQSLIELLEMLAGSRNSRVA